MIKRSFSLVVAFAFIGNVLVAQNVEQGKKFLYYEKYKSAKETFDKILASNPNNLDAVYWLGQTLLDKRNTVSRDTVAAKELYSKYLTQNGNAPLLLAGMGEIELMEGKTNEARQRFETALTLSKSKDVDVINAIGQANVAAAAGDAKYAIEKLNLAPAVRKFNNPDTYLIMGDAYRKLIDGGGAVSAYSKALELDPKLAAAKYSIARVYLTQNNPESFLPAYEDALKLDPAYAPAYYDLYYYWYSRDVNKASTYLDQYVANSDPGPEQEYVKADLLYVSGKYQEAKTRATELISQLGDKVAPRMYRMLAYTNDTLGDLAGAKQALNSLFTKAAPDEILPTDYEENARISGKQGDTAGAYANFKKAIEKDTVVANKVKFINKAAELSKSLKDRAGEATWLGMAYKLDPDPSQNALYAWGFAAYQGKNYPLADSIFCNVYQTKYPDQVYGYLWCARNAVAKDTTLMEGLHVEPYKKLVNFTDTVPDSMKVKFKAVALEGNMQLAQYFANVAKSTDSALVYLEKALALDPTNENLKGAVDQLKNPPQPQKQPATKTTKKPAAGATPPKKKSAGN
ncbi:MAG: tetratricopeptide repeat protein [Chitinophagaceae bacterium]|nr:MAG: tetratricopeptide repeat protein [Chitinophagaceae bacterium]